MQECIFCRIVNKQMQAKTVYEDDVVLAFLDINPLALGHTLLIPKKHVESIFEIDEKELEHLITIAKKLGIKIKEALEAEGINLIQSSGKAAGQVIPHFHLHIIPRKEGDEVRMGEWWRMVIKKFDDVTIEKTAESIRTALKEKIEKKAEEKPQKKVEEKPKERSKEEVYWIKRELELA